MIIRDAVDADVDALVELNAAAVPAVSTADAARMRHLLARAAACRVVDDGGAVVGFVLLFRPGADYDSANYAWFSERYDRFLYVDRVVVAEPARGGGVGRLLYDAVADEARRVGDERVTAEVNVEPPNPGSSRFHRREGFEPVGVLRHGDGYATEMLVRPVP